MAFRDRLDAVCARRGRLCVGIDPHPAQLEQWGLEASSFGLESFARGMVAALADRVAVFKPQSAFFEACGPEGLLVLQRVLGDIAQAGAVSILDVKRGDIGSTMAAYARAYLDPEAPLAADSITVSPYLGFGALSPAIELAEATGRGLFVLCRTSNPEGAPMQLATVPAAKGGPHPLSTAQLVVQEADRVNRSGAQHALGLVVGATRQSVDVDLSDFTGTILAPGIGAQGGRMEALAGIFGAALPRVLPSASREVAGAGPDRSALRDRVAELLA